MKQLEGDLPPTDKFVNNLPFTTLSIGVNADSLGTWFLDAVEIILKEQKIVLDIRVDNQDETQIFLRNGQVCGCITTCDKVLQGCRIVQLGCVEYGLFCTPDFAVRWFPHGLDVDVLATVPTIQFNRKDNFNEEFYKLLFGNPPDNPPTFYVPSTEIFVNFILRGLCYGVIPHHQSKPLSDSGKLVDLAPACKITIDLYYHFWNLKSVVMENFSCEFITRCQKALQPEIFSDI